MDNKTYINNLETGKIELHFTKGEYQALTDEQKKGLKSAYLFSRYAQAWVSRAKNNHYRALQVAGQLGFTEEETQGKRLTYEEELNKKVEKAERRSERYEQYSENAQNRAKNMQSELNSHHGDIAFFTQPNINSSGGRSFTNYRNKIFNRYNKGFEEYRKSEYFKEKAEIAQNTANKEQLKDRSYLCNRIKECRSIIKKYESYIVTAEEKSNNRTIEKYLSEIEYQGDKMAFMENCLDKLGNNYTKDNLKVGYLVKIRGEWEKILKLNRTTIESQPLEENIKMFIFKYPYAEIQEMKIPNNYKEPEKTLKNPYIKDDIIVNYSVDGSRIIEAYQVIKTTPKGVQIQKIDIEHNKPIKDSFTLDKPMRKKIVKSKYSNFMGVSNNNGWLYKWEDKEEDRAI